MDPIIKSYYEQRIDYGINSLRESKILTLLGDELSSKRILDVGCASGYLTKKIKQEDNYVAGVDISESNIFNLHSSVDKIFVMDVENERWPQEFIDRKFDIIIAAEIIEHLFDQEIFLHKLKIILKPSGVCVITTPNFLV